MYIYLDLDRTLIKTDVVGDALRLKIEQLYGVSNKVMNDDYPKFRPMHGTQAYYDFFGHMQSYGLEPDIIEPVLIETVASDGFLFDDALPMLDYLDTRHWPIEILTYGEPRFQLLKAKLVPRLAPYKGHAVLTEKSTFLAECPDDCVLIDDRPATLGDLPTCCTGILIDRTQTQKIIKTKEGYSINTLEAVKEILV